MTSTLCTSGNVKIRAGNNAETLTQAQYDELINGAEAVICKTINYDAVTNYDDISTIGKEILKEAVASYAALGVIAYSSANYFTSELLTLYNTNVQRWQDLSKQLSEEFVKDG